MPILTIFRETPRTSITTIHNSVYSIRELATHRSKYDIKRFEATTLHTSVYKVLLNNNHRSKYDIKRFKATTLHASNYGIRLINNHVSKYNILNYDIYLSIFESPYYILHRFGTENIVSYSIRLSTSHKSDYYIRYSLTKINESKYNILFYVSNVSSYTIHLGNKHQSFYNIKLTNTTYKEYSSEYLIRYKIDSDSESVYLILLTDTAVQYHRVKYNIAQEGIQGITERELGFWNSWGTISNDRQIHLHLYNTFTSDRSSTYDIYIVTSSNKNCFVKREIIGNDRNTLYEVYHTEHNDKRLYVNSYVIYENIRECETVSYKLLDNERKGICSQIAHLGDERKGFTLCIYNDYRWCTTNYWWPSDRICITHAKEKSVFADQRYLWGQFEKHKFETIRYGFTDVFHTKYNFTVNPHYFSFNFTISNLSGNQLFSVPVVDNNGQYYQFPIDDKFLNTDLILIDNYDNSITNLGKLSLSRQNIRTYTTHTKIFNGKLIPLGKPLYCKIRYKFMEIPSEYDGDEKAYYEYLRQHGYLKVVVGAEEMNYGEVTIVDLPKYIPIDINVQCLSTLVDKANCLIEIIWAYPYSELKINKCLLVFM